MNICKTFENVAMCVNELQQRRFVLKCVLKQRSCSVTWPHTDNATKAARLTDSSFLSRFSQFCLRKN